MPSLSHRAIARQRMLNQQIVRPAFTQPHDVVAWLGAVQAQDYLGALWAVGLRLPSATEQTIEQALAERTIVRTWPMRGTIHFVAASDVRWMLELLAPRVIQSMQGRLRQLSLDPTIIAASAKVVEKALEGGRQLPRPALYAILEAANIATSDQRGLHILGQLAHERLICFGARAGKQPTFTLLDEWAPSAKSLPRDAALATLALRYFTGHGPATLHDFMWWAGLTSADAKAGLGAAAPQLGHLVLDNQTYYFAADQPALADEPIGVSLLPPFDELLVAYRDRTATLDPQYAQLVVPGSNGIFYPIVVIDGRVEGLWKRVFKKDHVVMTFSPFTAWSEGQAQAIALAAEQYGRFVGKPVVVAPSAT